MQTDNLKLKKPLFTSAILAVLAAVLLSACAAKEEKSSYVTTTSALPESKLVSSGSDEAFRYDVYEIYAEVTAYIGTGAVVSVPPVYNDLPVISIGKKAFLGNTDITSVILPETVINIDFKAFAKCHNLTAVEMPGVRSIGMESFRGAGLTSVELPETLQNLGRHAFAETALTFVSLPSGVLRAGDYVFAVCKYLEGFSFPETATEITNRMFSNCPALTSVDVPQHITRIGDYAFAACPNLKELRIPSSVINIGQGLLYNSPATVIITPQDSEAQKYAIRNNIAYENELIE